MFHMWQMKFTLEQMIYEIKQNEPDICRMIYDLGRPI